ncbi:MauE/DoxX family redox-associated membrane protein [Kitasatospora camelliae]|uniref:MauE/DoxX family redox-associated membrane protein n=1 Tax=Kitasatospora camelliae TaxID=3156397 RepID=A0AAU8KAH2_9ACTN
MSVLVLGCRALLAVVFVVAVAGKARSRASVAAFTASLADFRWLPARLRSPVAVGTLTAEAAAVVLLAVAARAGAAAVLALLSVFTVATLRAGRAADCGCFTSGRAASGRAASGAGAFLGRNALLAVAALAVVSGPDRPVAPAPGAVAVLAGAAVGLLVTRWDDLAYLLRGPAAP